MEPALLGGIEAGGTKFVCAVGTGPEDVRAEERFPTTTPEETIGRAIGFFRNQAGVHGPVGAVGIGSFGPADVDPASASYGTITTTPKADWANTCLLPVVASALHIPIGFDTDVNAAALGEGRWGAGKGLDTFIYLTVGTGIGGGAIVGGRPIHGMMHPEMGHMMMGRDRERDPFPGSCPFHGDCLEGLASGPAIEGRWERSARDLPPDHEAWELEADYLASGLVAFIATLSPQRVILGGGVMEQEHLFPRIRQKVLDLANGYFRTPQMSPEGIGGYIVPPSLGNRAGLLGCFVLAEQALRRT